MPRRFRIPAKKRPAFVNRLQVEWLEDRALPSFVAAPTFNVGVNTTGFFSQSSNPIAVAVGDFNSDGKMDVVTANSNGLGLSLLRGNGLGGFLPCLNFATAANPSAITSADLNGDGRLDVVIASTANDTVTILRGNGDGTFKPALNYAAGADPISVAVADLNNDGKKDLAIADSGASTVTILFGSGTGSFTGGGTVVVGNNPTSVVAADFNNDGKPDLASVSGGFGHLDVNLNNGNGTFAGKVNYETGFVAHTVVVGFFNADAQPDLAVACDFPSSNGVSILLGSPDGSFPTFTNYDAGGQSPTRIAVADFNGDLKQDLVTANSQFANNSVSVLFGDGTGAFGATRVYTAGQGPVDLTVADFNFDGVPDVVTANHDGDVGNVSLLRGNGDGSLLASPNLVVPGPGPIATGDLTGDGIKDIAVTASSPSYSGVMIFPGNGAGGFGDPLQTQTINGPSALVVGDVNNDQKLDLVVAVQDTVAILLGNNNGTFATAVTYAAGVNPQWIVLGDFNNDLIPDIAVANDSTTGTGASILLGLGGGVFDTPTNVNAGGKTKYLATGDFNKDGKLDLALVYSSDPPHVAVMLGNGSGGFGTPKSYSTQVEPNSVGVGDFNGDTKPDLAVPTFFGSSVTIFKNGTGGNFSQSGEYEADSRPFGIDIADVTGDGKLDIAVVNNFSDNVYLFPGTGTGTFGAPKVYVVGDRPDWVASADFNQDGLLDLAVVNGNSGTITLLETPTAATSFRVSIVPSTTTAGKTFQVVVAAVDGAGRLTTNFQGIVHFSSSDTKAVLPASYTFTAADNGVKQFTFTLKTAGNQSVSVQSGVIAGSDSVPVVGANATHLGVVAAANPTAGAPFNVTVRALDKFGNVATSYRGTVHLFTNDTASGVFVPGNYTFTAGDNGVHTFTGGATLITAGTRTISVKPTNGLWLPVSTPVAVQGAAAASLSVSAPVSITAGAPLSVTVTARDQYGNVATGFTGTVQLTSSDGNATLPADYTFVAGDKGVRVLQPVLKTAGAQSVTVASSGLPSAQLSGITVKPGAAANAVFVQGPSNTFIATAFKPGVTVQVTDAFGNAVKANVNVSLIFGTNPTGALLSGNLEVTNAAGLATFSGVTVNKGGQGYTLIAKAGSAISPPSPTFDVYKTTHFTMTVSGGTQVQAGVSFTVTVTALTAQNVVDTSYLGTVRFTSSASPLASLPPDYTFVAGDNGVHTFTVTLNKIGLQTITVADLLKATVKKSTSVTVS